MKHVYNVIEIIIKISVFEKRSFKKKINHNKMFFTSNILLFRKE